MKYLVEYIETFTDADGYVYNERNDVEYSAESSDEAQFLFFNEYPNTIHFTYEVKNISPLELTES